MQEVKKTLRENQQFSATTAYLPVTSFVPFEARRCKEPCEFWKNEKQSDPNFDLTEFAISSPLSGEASTSHHAEQLELLADRYGGDGIRNHGGGVRCAIWRGMQIKGVGANILGSNKQTDFFHSYGGASLQEGIRDSLWGEVCNVALPYGGVRVAGLVGTGTVIPPKIKVSRK